MTQLTNGVLGIENHPLDLDQADSLPVNEFAVSIATQQRLGYQYRKHE